MSGHVELSGFDAAIVMSHHLASDRQYLAQLSTSDISYVGLLGPKERRRRLLAELGDAAAALDGRLHGPAGLDIGAVGPAAIALSIISEIYSVLSVR
jgi:xanthine/CO dehydrogenase XdhC/CoxF family maturation factor